MSFVLAPHESPGEGLSRVIREQVHKLSAECAEAGQEQAAFAHKARVRCKRIRAALRLAKPLMGGKAFRRENRWWRDQARLLSELRDAGARIEALDTLRPFLASRIGSDATRKLEERFLRGRRIVEAEGAIKQHSVAIFHAVEAAISKCCSKCSQSTLSCIFASAILCAFNNALFFIGHILFFLTGFEKGFPAIFIQDPPFCPPPGPTKSMQY